MSGQRSGLRRLVSAPLLPLLLTLSGLALFSKGFFPVKPLLSGLAEQQSYSTGAGADDAPFSRLAFVVVDALRSDFLFGPHSHFSFAQSLISTGHALPYTAIAQAPTVTLPRLKALTTGSNPTFLDAILNIAEESVSSAVLENVDSWVGQLERKGKKVVFAGDDTWLRLFPERWFEWSEGVSSFFVSDTETVDTNVTRHLDTLLSLPPLPSPYPYEWDVLILHYLGLDHVGHLGGPKSPLMAPKQREMDDVVRRLYKYLEQRDAEDGGRSLLVVVGDHGMTEGGNHGGSTEAEISAALLLASPYFSHVVPPQIEHDSLYKHHEIVQQLDLVPTLSVLFDLGVPTNSMGKLIVSAIEALRPSSLRQAIMANVVQLSAVIDAGSVSGSKKLLCEAAENSGESCELQMVGYSNDVLLEFLSRSQSTLLTSTALFSPLPLLSGLSLLALSSLLALLPLRPFLRFERPVVKWAVGGMMSIWCASCWASSFVEEEHEGWYFFGTTGAVLLAFSPTASRLDRVLLLLSAASIRLMRAWAHNGQKNLPNLSISHYLSNSPSLTSFFVVSTYGFFLSLLFYTLFTAARTLRATPSSPSPPPATLLRYALTFAVVTVAGTTQVLFGLAGYFLPLALDEAVAEGGKATWLDALEKLELGDKVTLARAGYVAALVGWVVCRLAKRSMKDDGLKDKFSTLILLLSTLFLLPLSRPQNTPLFLLFYILHLTLHRLARRGLLSPLGVAASVVTWQALGFFALGGSNALASVDLSNAYHGLSTYSLPLVFALTFLSNFSLPVLSSLSLASLLSTAPTPSRRLIHRYITAFHVLATACLCASAWWFKSHLFSMTVFAPAVLVRAVWVVDLQVGTNLGLARALMGRNEAS